MASLRDELLVLLRRQELVPLAFAGGLDDEHPTLAVGILIKQFRRATQFFIHRDNIARGNP